MFFRYGVAQPGAEPLALLGGALILDSGESDQSFLFRCQDRFVTYAWLLGLRPILLAEDAAMARQTVDAIAALRADCVTIARACGLTALLRPPEPLILACDPLTATLFPLARPTLTRHAVFYLNQVSPTAALLVKGAATALSNWGIQTGVNHDRLEADARRALRLHDKRAAIAVARTCALPAPRMLTTETIDANELATLNNWGALQAWYRAKTDEAAPDALVIKSTRDSAGNVAAVLNAGTFSYVRKHLLEMFVRSSGGDMSTALASIRADIAESRLDPTAYPDDRLRAFEELRRERRGNLAMLVQRFIHPAPSVPAKPASLGISFHVGERGVQTLAIAAQTYHDADRRHFRGAMLDRRIDAAFTGSRFEAEMRNLAGHFAAQGYNGPIGFDALCDADGEYTLIQDCNPRLSAILPTLAIHRALRPAPRSLLSLGYRGEVHVPDLPAALAALDGAGLLYGARRRSGLLPLPSMVGAKRVDLLLVDSPPHILDHAAAALASVGVQAAISSAIPGLPTE